MASNCPSCKAPIADAAAKTCSHCGTALALPTGAAVTHSGSGNGGLGAFLREYWVWIVAPIVVGALVLAALLWLTSGDDTSPFVYSIF